MLEPLDELLAREAIRQLMAQYNTAGDTGRREELASVFADDAHLVAPGLDLHGKQAIVAGLFRKPDAAAPRFKVYRHHLTTSKVEFISKDAAKARTYFFVITEIGLDHTGVYTDEFRRDPAGWVLSRRAVRLDHVSQHSLQFPHPH